MASTKKKRKPRKILSDREKFERKTIYLTVNEEPDNLYWNQFESIKDALSNNDNEDTEIFVTTPRKLGTYKMDAVLIEQKRKKRK